MRKIYVFCIAALLLAATSVTSYALTCRCQGIEKWVEDWKGSRTLTYTNCGNGYVAAKPGTKVYNVGVFDEKDYLDAAAMAILRDGYRVTALCEASGWICSKTLTP